VFAALTQLGIAVQLTANTLLIVLGGLELAAAIAFGFGAQNVARDIVERAYERCREEARGEPAERGFRDTRRLCPQGSPLRREE
jgi:hypothetical protein